MTNEEDMDRVFGLDDQDMDNGILDIDYDNLPRSRISIPDDYNNIPDTF
jgi:hypothetical protein